MTLETAFFSYNINSKEHVFDAYWDNYNSTWSLKRYCICDSHIILKMNDTKAQLRARLRLHKDKMTYSTITTLKKTTDNVSHKWPPVHDTCFVTF